MLRCHTLSSAISAVDSNAFSLLWRHKVTLTVCSSQAFLIFTTHVHLPRNLGIFVDLLFCVPEPLVDLIDLKVQLLGQRIYFLPRWGLPIKPLVQIPKGVLLALRLASPVRSFRSQTLAPPARAVSHRTFLRFECIAPLPICARVALRC